MKITWEPSDIVAGKKFRFAGKDKVYEIFEIYVNGAQKVYSYKNENVLLSDITVKDLIAFTSYELVKHFHEYSAVPV